MRLKDMYSQDSDVFGKIFIHDFGVVPVPSDLFTYTATDVEMMKEYANEISLSRLKEQLSLNINAMIHKYE